MSTLHLKDVRHEILNVVCTEVTPFCPPHRCEHYFVFKLISFAKGPKFTAYNTTFIRKVIHNSINYFQEQY